MPFDDSEIPGDLLSARDRFKETCEFVPKGVSPGLFIVYENMIADGKMDLEKVALDGLMRELDGGGLCASVAIYVALARHIQ